MVHYRHSYHAGNFADVFKHVLLVGLLQALSRKDKPWCFVETHAGAGRYDLNSIGALRTGESKEGIARLQPDAAAPAMIAAYLDLIAAENPGAEVRDYPGSPVIAQRLARPQDRLLLCELVPEVAQQLRQALGSDPRVVLHARDGYEAHSLLPPAEKRGLVLIDPPFERTDEFEAIADLIQRGAPRFAGGVFVAWYPLKNRHEAGRFVRRVARDTGEPALNVEFDTGAPAQGQMHACGLVVAHPPFGFARAAQEALDWLQPRLAQGPRAAASVTEVQP